MPDPDPVRTQPGDVFILDLPNPVTHQAKGRTKCFALRLCKGQMGPGPVGSELSVAVAVAGQSNDPHRPVGFPVADMLTVRFFFPK